MSGNAATKFDTVTVVKGNRQVQRTLTPKEVSDGNLTIDLDAAPEAPEILIVNGTDLRDRTTLLYPVSNADEAAFESIGSPLQTTIEWLDDSTDILARVHADLEAALDRANSENDLYRFGLEALLKSIDRLRAGEFKNDRDLIALRNLAEGIRDSAQTRTHRESLIPILSALACFTAEFRARFAKRRFTAKERNP